MDEMYVWLSSTGLSLFFHSIWVLGLWIRALTRQESGSNPQNTKTKAFRILLPGFFQMLELISNGLVFGCEEISSRCKEESMVRKKNTIIIPVPHDHMKRHVLEREVMGYWGWVRRVLLPPAAVS